MSRKWNGMREKQNKKKMVLADSFISASYAYQNTHTAIVCCVDRAKLQRETVEFFVRWTSVWRIGVRALYSHSYGYC